MDRLFDAVFEAILCQERNCIRICFIGGTCGTVCFRCGVGVGTVLVGDAVFLSLMK